MNPQAKISLFQLLERSYEIVRDEGRQVLRDQGHRASGQLERSFERQIRATAVQSTVEVLIEKYGLDIDRKRKPSEFPTTGFAFRELIDELTEWLSYVKPNQNPRERQWAAGRIAGALAREGSPTRGSLRFSKTGNRTGWIKETAERSEEKIAHAIEDSNFVEFLVVGGLQ